MIIGDVHGTIDELRQLLLQNGFTINASGMIQPPLPYRIVLLGDFIDKASDIKLKETLTFIHQNYFSLNQEEQQFYLVMGNHEWMVYRYITQDPTLDWQNPKGVWQKKHYYNTVRLLEEDRDLKAKFLALYEVLHVWLKYEYAEAFSVTLTHAPCEERYLTQENPEAYAKMIKCASRSKNPELSLDALIPYVHQEAKENNHYHIFGHLSQPDIRRYKNRICIDTGAIYGNKLSAVLLERDQLRFDAVSFLGKQKAVTSHNNLLFDFPH